MVHTLGGLGHPEITRGSLIPTLWVSHRSFGDMGGESIHADPLLLLLERLHHEPEKRSAPISSTVRVEGNWPRQRE